MDIPKLIEGKVYLFLKETGEDKEYIRVLFSETGIRMEFANRKLFFPPYPDDWLWVFAEFGDDGYILVESANVAIQVRP